MTVSLTIEGLRLGRGGNDRLHWRAKVRQKNAEREAVAWQLAMEKPAKPSVPCIVTITRMSPGNGIDDDNLVSCAKAVRDQIAEWIGVDDRDSERVRYVVKQERGPWSVRIQFESAEKA